MNLRRWKSFQANHAIEVEADPARIPGAVWIDFERLDEQASRIPTGREIILYCT